MRSAYQRVVRGQAGSIPERECSERKSLAGACIGTAYAARTCNDERLTKYAGVDGATRAKGARHEVLCAVIGAHTTQAHDRRINR